ncbi:hypothetical protein KJ991_00710 [Patescibacteria group bacterium]|nr:hypothetical protein [Patescibacteria group bacterium]MBU4057524.1 hypothetical protein [Patescibacteria group bacterium]MBU4116100.1 hypothetical protein [Patescibacteria group bacterium]
MTPDEKELLEKTYKLSEENNNILKKMRRSVVYSRILRIIYILIALGLATSLYYYIQPYLNNIIGAYNNVMTGAQKLKETGDSIPTIQDGSNMDSIKSIIESLSR